MTTSYDMTSGRWLQSQAKVTTGLDPEAHPYPLERCELQLVEVGARKSSGNHLPLSGMIDIDELLGGS